MKKISLIDEDFMDFPIGEFPYDKNHSAIGEYHFIHFLDFMDDGMTLYVTTDITDRVLHGALWSIMADIIWNR